jgi:hypothetical protein
MGREYEATWDAASAHLVWRANSGLGAPSRFTRTHDGVWRGVSGEHVGELLHVLRDAGAVTGLDITTYVFRRAPMADD